MIDRSAHKRHIEKGERRKDEGMNAAAARHPDRVTIARLAMLRALLHAPDGTASLDDATPADELASQYADGGMWRGQVIRSLIADDFVEHVGYVKTIRPAGHRRPIALLRLTDPVAAKQCVGRLQAAVDLQTTREKTGTDAATSVPAIITFTTSQGATNDGQTV